MVEIWGFVAPQQDLSIEYEDESWALFSSLISPLLASRLKRYVDYGGILYLCLFALEMHTKGTEWKASLLSQPICLFWFLWVFSVNLGFFFAPVDNMVIKSMNSASQGFYCLLVMTMTFTTNAHMLLISPAWEWIYFKQNATCFPRDHRGNWFVHDKCFCLSEKTERTSQKNRRSCVGAMCWWLPIYITLSTRNSSGSTSCHLSLKDRNSPQTTTAQTSRKNTEHAFIRGFQTADCGHERKRNSHGALVRLFCRLRTCSVHRVGYWEMSEEKSTETVLLASQKRKLIHCVF